MAPTDCNFVSDKREPGDHMGSSPQLVLGTAMGGRNNRSLENTTGPGNQEGPQVYWECNGIQESQGGLRVTM